MDRHAATWNDHLRRRARIALLLVMVALATACGSTVQVGQGGLAVDGSNGLSPSDAALASGDGLSVDGTAGLDPATGQPAAPGTAGGAAGTTNGGATIAGGSAGATTPGASGSGGRTAAGGSGTPGAGSDDPASPGRAPGTQPNSPRSPGGRSGVVGPGVTATEITVGMTYATDNGANDELLGAAGITQGNQRRYWRIMRDQINAEGGIAGRKVRLSEYGYSTATGAEVARLESEACEYWARDDRAFVASGFSNSDRFLTCLKSNGIASTGSTLMIQDDPAMVPFPGHFIPGGMSLTSQMVNMTRGLVALKYFDRGYKLGVVTTDTPPFVRSVEGTLRSSLAKHGLKIEAEVQRIRPLESTNDVAEITAQIQSAVLKFKTEDVTHVMIIEEDGLLTLLFARSAENQDYRPRYGVNSQNGGTLIAGVAPEGQFSRAVGIGWMPAIDVRASEMPNSPEARRCLAMFKREGEEPPDANVRAIMLSVCEDMRFFKASIERGLPDITYDSFRRGAESLGSSFPSFTGTGNAVIGPGHHAGVANYRHVRYDGGCTCFHYTSRLIRGR